jgi:hypothetical protein
MMVDYQALQTRNSGKNRFFFNENGFCDADSEFDPDDGIPNSTQHWVFDDCTFNIRLNTDSHHMTVPQ